MFKKIRISLKNNVDKEKINICWALIDHRIFAHYSVTPYRTTFYLTKKEFETYKDLTERK